MNQTFRRLIRIAVTLTVVVAAVLAGRELWGHYMEAPWTRDARVRADVVEVAPDVSGLVSEVAVHDNQTVARGDLLFRVDRQRFSLALEQAEAVAEGRKATLDQARRDRARYQELRDVVSQQKAEQAAATAAEATAGYRQALAERDLAKLNLERSDVKAAANGVITNLHLRPGDYVTAGQAEVALVDTDSLHIEGYFEETKLPRIHVGDAVSIRLMGHKETLRGHVESISGGIEDRERTAGTGLLANINPTFSWVRLAQRVPIRISIDTLPSDFRLIAGSTATVAVEAPDAGEAAARDPITRLAALIGLAL